MAAARKRARRAGDAALAARNNAYVQRIVEDAELRDNIRDAVEQSKKAYARLSNGKAPAKALMEDKKLQKELRQAALALGAVGVALHEGPKRKRKRHWGRRLFILAVGASPAPRPSRDPGLEPGKGAPKGALSRSASLRLPTPSAAAQPDDPGDSGRRHTARRAARRRIGLERQHAERRGFGVARRRQRR